MNTKKCYTCGRNIKAHEFNEHRRECETSEKAIQFAIEQELVKITRFLKRLEPKRMKKHKYDRRKSNL